MLLTLNFLRNGKSLGQINMTNFGASSVMSLKAENVMVTSRSKGQSVSCAILNIKWCSL